MDTSLPEVPDREMDAFLDEVHKKKVSDEIRQRNRRRNYCMNRLIRRRPRFPRIFLREFHHDSRIRIILVTIREVRKKTETPSRKLVTMSQENDDDTELIAKGNQSIEQELTKELLSGNIIVRHFPLRLRNSCLKTARTQICKEMLIGKLAYENPKSKKVRIVIVWNIHAERKRSWSTQLKHTMMEKLTLMKHGIPEVFGDSLYSDTLYSDDDRGRYLSSDTEEIRYKETTVF